jgi:agmatine deiminase
VAINHPENHALLRAYRMPAEWEPHLATYLVWPHNLDTWPGKFEPVQPAYAKMAAAIAEFEPIRVLVKSADEIEPVRALIRTAISNPTLMDRVELIVQPTNDSWIRDHGPIFVNRISGNDGPRQIALDWIFNSWGEKYGAYDLDDAIPHRLAERYGFEVIAPGIVLEGGSIDVNGEGLLLTTESCLLNENRNPHLSRENIEEYLMTYLGVAQVLWLGDGIKGDDTDGHIDDLARFVTPHSIVTVIEDDPADANYQALQDNLKRLHAMRDQHRRPFKIEMLPMPTPVVYDDTRLPASYANFYIANGSVIVPTFDCPADDVAMRTLQRLFPSRRVIGVPSADLVWGLGAVHCLTQQHPAPSPR